MPVDRILNTAQEAALAHINDNWPVADWERRDDGTVHVTCDDGDTAIIQPDGEWDWS